MKSQDITRIPLAFLFAPTILASLAIYLFFQVQLQSSFETQRKTYADYLLFQIALVIDSPLKQGQYAQVRQALWSFAQHHEPGIDNIVVYDGDGQLVTALSPDKSGVESMTGEMPRPRFFETLDGYHAWGTIAALGTDVNVDGAQDIAGYVEVRFSRQMFNLDGQRNLLICCVIILLAIFVAVMLWRYRHVHFNRQMLLIVEALDNLNKGYKQAKLPSVKGYWELNALQRRLGSLVGFYEKRLTMKQFEVSALEQTVTQLNDKIAALQQQKEDAELRGDTAATPGSSLLSDMFQICYQSLQAQLASIEQTVNDKQQCLWQQAEDTMPTPVTAQINRLNQLLGDLKALYDVTGEQPRRHLEYVDVAQLLGSVSRLFRPRACEKALEFLLCRPDEELEVELDVSQVQKILLTLLQSAVASTSRGYIKLSLSVTSLERPDESGNDHRLCCDILDTGQGLSNARYTLLAHDKVDAELAEDDWIVSGLQLMVAKKTVESMGGGFTVKSLAGLGCQIGVQFPCRAVAQPLPDMSHLLGRQVMLFDPVGESAEIIGNMLHEFGASVHHALDKAQFEQMLGQEKGDIVILSRPCAESTRAPFDADVQALVQSNLIERGLFLCDGCDPDYNLPKQWTMAEKPLSVGTLNRHFPPQAVAKAPSGLCGETLLDGNAIEILAVDDTETNLRLLSAVLRAYPVKLTQASSGKEAIERCRQRPFDIILMDKEMPTMSGAEASGHIRSLPLHEKTPVVLFTAHIDDLERARLIGQNIDDCMEKPLDEDKFYQLMENWCAERWQQVSVNRAQS